VLEWTRYEILSWLSVNHCPLKTTVMLNRRRPAGSLLLAGLAAFAYYKYSKMSDQQKKDIVDKIKSQGKRLYDQFMPSNAKQAWASDARPANNRFGEGSDYTG
jgi:hypothetical protein